MKAIYTRTMRVKDDSLDKAMEIGKGLAAVRKKYFPNHEVYFSFQMGGDPRTIRETLIGTMFEGDGSDENMSADPEYQKLQKQLKDVAIEGTIEDEIRPIFSE
ncbi:hypothetical protein N9K55_00320 [Candidatus Pelagibacter bacterium]|nr:hypothetical protein [Candidatus Pelagibacter bacterium]